MNVTCTGWRVKDEVIQLAPINISNQLLQRIRRHAASPERCGLGIDKETHAQQLHTIFLYRHNKLSAFFLDGVNSLIFYAEHLGHGWSKDVSIQ